MNIPPELQAANLHELSADQLTEALQWYMAATQPCNDEIVETVVQKLRSRSDTGLAKYGHTLVTNPLSVKEWLQHAQEEAMDLANYLQVLIDITEDKPIIDAGSNPSPKTDTPVDEDP